MYSHFSATDWVTPFGLVFLLAVAVAWWYARRNAKVIGIDGSHVDLIVPMTLIVGVIGGTVLAIFMPMDHRLAGEAMNHGIRLRLFGILGTGAIAVFVYSRLSGLSFRRVLDVFALPTIFGIAIHRVGCYFAGCCWGDIVAAEPLVPLSAQIQTLPWLGRFAHGVHYPPGSLPYEQHLALGLIEPGALASLPVHPVQLYEVALLLLILLVLRRVRWQALPRGALAVMTVCSYAFMRFFVEYLRADGSISVGNLTSTQLQCLALLVSVILLPGMRRRVVS